MLRLQLEACENAASLFLFFGQDGGTGADLASHAIKMIKDEHPRFLIHKVVTYDKNPGPIQAYN